MRSVVSALLTAAAALASLPASTQSTGTMLAMYLNGSALDGMIEFSFERDGCTGHLAMTQRYQAGDVRSTRTEFQVTDLVLDDYQIAEAEGGVLAQIMLDHRAGSEGFPFSSTLVTDSAETRAGWESQGAVCEDNSCSISLEMENATLVVAGPNAGSRVDFVLSDLRALQSECTSSEEGE
ncbi:hypothetical protein [Pararhodobacter marinus]|uniref:hypothetical protein n=1 Tax=Pararhodobacter marinus TaxID=2184063 RepID=UPI003511E964